jgi:hypothetical protein
MRIANGEQDFVGKLLIDAHEVFPPPAGTVGREDVVIRPGGIGKWIEEVQQCKGVGVDARKRDCAVREVASPRILQRCVEDACTLCCRKSGRCESTLRGDVKFTSCGPCRWFHPSETKKKVLFLS